MPEIQEHQQYYLGENAPNPLPFDGLNTVSHYIMPNFATMDWDGISRLEVDLALREFADPVGAMQDELMIYIHVPYCKSFCHYCNFNRSRYPRQEEEQLERYADYLIKELDWYLRQPYVMSRRITAIYIGGGSPSTLPTSAVERLCAFLQANVPNFDSIEKSFTGEPRTLRRPDLLEVLQAYGWDRVTFGIETLNPEIHKKIGRHDSREDLDAVFQGLSDIGYEPDTCVDMMYDLPGQTLEGFQGELEELLRCYDPTEIDAFTTVYLPYRPLHRLIMRGRVDQPGTGWQILQMREHLYDYLLANGYHNNIAETYSKRAERSQYQTAHCARQDILGVGCAARGNIKDYVSINPDSIEKWEANVDAYGASTETLQPIGLDGVMDRVMVMFPRYKHLSKDLLRRFEGVEGFDRVQSVLNSHLDAGVIEESADAYTMNKLGVIWHGNLQTDYMKHSFNTQGQMLIDHLTEPTSQLENESRFEVTIQTKFIKENDELYPRLMK